MGKLPNLQSVKLARIQCKDGELVACPKHSFPVLRILEVLGYPIVLTFEKGSLTQLERLVLAFLDTKMSIVGVENLESLKEVKLRGVERNQEMGRLVKQLRRPSTGSNPIKFVADWYSTLDALLN